MAMLGLISASIDLTQTIWFPTIFSSTWLWRQEEQIMICSVTMMLRWKYLQPRGLQLDLFLLLPCGCHFILWFRPLIYILVEGTISGMFQCRERQMSPCCTREAWITPCPPPGHWVKLWLGWSQGYGQPDSVSHFTVAESPTLLTSAHGHGSSFPKGHWYKSPGWTNSTLTQIRGEVPLSAEEAVKLVQLLLQDMRSGHQCESSCILGRS